MWEEGERGGKREKGEGGGRGDREAEGGGRRVRVLSDFVLWLRLAGGL